ncbi:MAG: hypothetical protein B6229_01880 [Spirochaetaceae bacterium 4572_7]|nr:MAG: hypothetical protein B6229_01880 [Spirochaetaceae bacterium 4572_7]
MKIQKRLLLSILPVVIVVTGIILIISTTVSTHNMESSITENAQLLNSSYSHQLNYKLIQMKRISKNIATAIITAVNVETVLIDSRKNNPEFNRVFYSTIDGEIIDMAPYNSSIKNYNFTRYSEWAKVIKTKKTHITDPVEFMGNKSFLLFTPIVIDYLIDKEAKITGILVSVISTDYVFDKFKNIVYGDTGSIFVLNKEGYYIYSTSNEDIMTKQFRDTESDNNLTYIENAMTKSNDGIAIFYSGSDKYFVSFSPVINEKWSLGIIGLYSEFTKDIYKLFLINILILLIGTALASIIIYFIVKGVVRPLTTLTDMAEKISHGDMTLRSKLSIKNEIGILSRAMDGMLEHLATYNQKLEKKVLERTKELYKSNEELTTTIEELDYTNKALETTRDALWTEISLAEKLQKILLPKNPHIDNFEIAAFMKTADSVGGDYYDVINIEGRDWFLIGDVSGHGVTSGLVMMMVQTSIHVALSQNPDIRPEKLLTIINETIYNNISKLGGKRYMTLTVFACLDDCTFSFAGAHLPIIIYRKKTERLEIIETPGAWIGLVENITDMNRDKTFTMDNGDTILLYTDGLTEATKKSGELFSQESLMNLFKENSKKSPKEICDKIAKISTALEIDDDISVMILRKVGP